MLRIFRHLSLNSVKKSHKSVESVCNLALIRLSLPRPLSTSTPSDHSSDPYEERPQFPGSRSEWTQELKFIDPTNYEGIPVYRVVDKNGNIFARDLKSLHEKFDKEFLQKLYRGLYSGLGSAFKINIDIVQGRTN